MSLRDKFKSKKGVSVMIGYVLLIGIAIVISGFVFIAMRSYVPVEEGKCTDGASLIISEIKCVSGNTLNITLKNNGRFDIGGYHIHATTSSDQELATKDLTDYFDMEKSSGGYKMNGAQAILFEQGVGNLLPPSRFQEHVFNAIPKIYSVEIIPIRFEKVNNRDSAVSCGNAKIVENIKCGS